MDNRGMYGSRTPFEETNSDEPSPREGGLSALHHCRTSSPEEQRLEGSEVLCEKSNYFSEKKILVKVFR